MAITHWIVLGEPTGDFFGRRIGYQLSSRTHAMNDLPKIPGPVNIQKAIENGPFIVDLFTY